MKLYQYWREDRLRLAIEKAGTTIDPLDVLSARRELTPEEQQVLSGSLELIRAGARGTGLVNEAFAAQGLGGQVDLSSVRLAAPLVPGTLLCSGSNYLDHVAEKANTDISGKEPEFFVKPSDCVAGPEQEILWSPRLTQKLDAETELAIVIGKPGRDIPVERALDHVYGYTIVNDLTARDLQVRFRADGSTWYEVGRGKVFETSAPLGPCIVTSDEIPDPQTLGLRTRVNGQLRQNGNTAQMIFTVAHLVHFFSVSLTLRPGTVIITGTPAGTAWSADPELGGRWAPGNGIVKADGYLKEGDIIECEIDQIGVLRNTVARV